MHGTQSRLLSLAVVAGDQKTRAKGVPPAVYFLIYYIELPLFDKSECSWS